MLGFGPDVVVTVGLGLVLVLVTVGPGLSGLLDLGWGRPCCSVGEGSRVAGQSENYLAVGSGGLLRHRQLRFRFVGPGFLVLGYSYNVFKSFSSSLMVRSRMGRCFRVSLALASWIARRWRALRPQVYLFEGLW